MRSSRISLAILLGLTAILPAAAPAHAQLLDNPGFDVGVAGWSVPSGGATLEWSDLDFEGAADSGSALVTNVATEPGSAEGAGQCVFGVEPGEGYWLGSAVRFPGSQVESGSANLLYTLFSGANCTDYLTSGWSASTASAPSEVWRRLGLFFTLPETANSARIRLSVFKVEATGSLAAQFDDVVLVPALFVDGFEAGNFDAWSTLPQ